jgi:hypothetical protein
MAHGSAFSIQILIAADIVGSNRMENSCVMKIGKMAYMEGRQEGRQEGQ